jgi:UDP:flavonoid glycosyltransferase YjiC (YdhE family)
MSRFLFVVPPLHGHVNPTIATAGQLADRGHQVAWVGPPLLLTPLLPEGARLFPAAEDLGADTVSLERVRAANLRGPAAFQFLWEDFLLPLAVVTAAGVERAVDAFAPDVVVADQQAIAGAIVARQRHLPWVTSATTPAELTRPFELLPKVGEWVRQHLVQVQLDLGVPESDARRGDLRFSDQLILAFTTELLMGESAAAVPPSTAFVGPAFGGRPRHDPFPWDWLEEESVKVLVSLGTVNAEAGDRFFGAAVEALDGLEVAGPDGATRRVQAILVCPPDHLPALPANVMALASVPQLDLLSHLDAVVCHAGNNTVCESLAHGLPMVLAPIRDDQPIVAEQVVAAGAGCRVRFGRVRAEELRRVLTDVLVDPSYRAAAGRIQASFEAAGGAGAAADLLVSLARPSSGG